MPVLLLASMLFVTIAHAAPPTFAPVVPGSATIPKFSMNSTTYNGFGFIKGFASKFPEQVTEANLAAQRGLLLFDINDNSIPNSQVRFEWTDANGKRVFEQGGEVSKGQINPVTEASNAYKKHIADSQKNEGQQKQGEILVVETQYEYVGPLMGTTGPNNELILHGRPLSPGQPISDNKQQELAIYSGTGNGNVVKLGSAFVGAGPYKVQANCQDNRGVGTPKLIRLPKLDENSFETCKDAPGQNPNSNWNLGGTGSNLNGAAGAGAGGLGSMMGAGGLNSILPLLMSGLLGGGQGQGGYGQQNPYGAGYNQQQQNCASIAQSPVCGADGKTYNNACYATTLGGGIKNQGVCVTPTPSPNIAAISQTIINQLNASGIPAAILEQVRNTVMSVLGGVLNGGAGTAHETKIQ